MVSIQYSGTGALKTDFTRTGKRTKLGAMKDGLNSLTRYYKNNFADGYRQVRYVSKNLTEKFSIISVRQNCDYVSYPIGFAGALPGSLHRPGWRVYLRSVSLGFRAKLALCYIPTCSYSRVINADRARNLAVTLYNGGPIVHAILGWYGSRYLRHHYPSRQAIR